MFWNAHDCKLIRFSSYYVVNISLKVTSVPTLLYVPNSMLPKLIPPVL